MSKVNNPKKTILLIGASIGELWDFPNIANRIGNNTFNFESIAEYDPDKGPVLSEVVNRVKSKPEIIIFKECASYFKADTDEYNPEYISTMKENTKLWIDKCKENNIIPILATVVPITEKMPLFFLLKRFIKKYVFLRSLKKYNRIVRLKGICDYNDWINKYAIERDIIVLDLEKELRISEKNRFLNPKYSTDGLHINQIGYQKLDVLFSQILKQLYSLLERQKS